MARIRRQRLQRFVAITFLAAGGWLLWEASHYFFQSSDRVTFAPVHPAEPSIPIKQRAARSTARESSHVTHLSIPRLGREWNVVEGTTRAALRKAPGHLENTPLPGESGNAVIAAHRDTHFRALKDIRFGDQLLIRHNGRSYTYEVEDMRVVPPTDTTVLQSSAEPVLTLVTCYPFYYAGSAPKRFIVRASLISGRVNAKAAQPKLRRPQPVSQLSY